ncbi:MAG: mechanosensitive ion channel family protein [Deltaproteobacteria bacterium]
MSGLLSNLLSHDALSAATATAAASGLRILIIAAAAYIALKFLSTLVGRVEALAARKEGGFTSAIETEKRIKTLGNLLRKAATVAVFIIAFMMIFKEVGVDIAPIIAGAGILGLAVGFGSQNLVRDIISGFFIIMENQVRIGDAVVINGVSGSVEEINLRTIVVRDIEGTVYVFPNGTISTLGNKSMGWSRCVIDVGVGYKENIDYVMRVIREVGEKLSKDENFASFILEPPLVLGVDRFGPSEVVVRCLVKTQPMKQWDVGRELRRRIKNAFDQRGIEMPTSNVSISAGEATKLPEAGATNEILASVKKAADKNEITVDEALDKIAGRVSDSGSKKP